ncbi:MULTISPECIES: GNAT family N-acetyltransferase [unclassified Phenylobacterium]|uniref:GNAT family N-acetyltransferase n=1 Tax=unclassified Phenylobacterium TaxID=2640670 RepID=UPI00083A4292|nr:MULTISPECIES: GNAT family N-acetyltransferase [unclassified Phenylobacterium]
MPEAFVIRPAISSDDISAVAALFQAYAASLPVDLGYQDFGSELAALPGKYGPPAGALLLARGAGDAPLGCVGLRPIAPAGCCEMKRLYVSPAGRGLGLGRALAQAAVGRARAIGYTELRLDTLPDMASAIGLYERMGFARIAPYYAPTPPGTIFMALTL